MPINISHIDKIAFIRKAYALSKPQGMGIHHYVPGELSLEDAKSILKHDGTFFMDYVHGRAVKIGAHEKEDGGIYIPDNWYDHTEEQFAELKKEFGL